MTDESAASRAFAARLEASALAVQAGRDAGHRVLVLGWLERGGVVPWEAIGQTADASEESKRERRVDPPRWPWRTND